jgi:hypothetical protein
LRLLQLCRVHNNRREDEEKEDRKGMIPLVLFVSIPKLSHQRSLHLFLNPLDTPLIVRRQREGRSHRRRRGGKEDEPSSICKVCIFFTNKEGVAA